MARKPRVTPGGYVYHVLNRSAGRFKLFRSARDFDAFERILVEAHKLHPLRILSYCVLSNHWHFVVWPEREGQVTPFFRWLAHTHAMREETTGSQLVLLDRPGYSVRHGSQTARHAGGLCVSRAQSLGRAVQTVPLREGF